MKVSFSTARKLGIGMLLGIVMLGTAFSVHSLRHVTKELYEKIELQKVKEIHFSRLALRFAMAGSDYYRYRLQGKLTTALPKLVQHLNTIRGILAQLSALPLTPGETEVVNKLRFEEKRFRTVMYVFLASGVNDPAQETAAKAVIDIENLVDNAVAQAIHYSYRASELIEQTNRQIVQSAHRVTTQLTIGGGLAAVVGLCVGLILSWSFKRHLAVILHATQAFGTGNLSYRIHSPFKDSMGQLANSIDDMASSLEAYEGRQQTMLEELMEAKDVSDAQAHELANRAFELDRARQAAEAGSLAKSQFLANMSHELRTPLNAIIGYSEMLIEDAIEQDQSEPATNLQIICTAGEQLLILINDILGLSELEAGIVELHLETFAVADMIHELRATIGPMVETNTNTLDVQIADDVDTMHADLTKVRQSVLNLLSNACKFTVQGAISLQVARETVENRDWLTFCVRDTGLGMRPEQIEKLFKEFVQADASSTREYGGTGLGLASTRRFFRLLGGDVGVASTPGQGSTFTIRLPRAVTGYDIEPEGSEELVRIDMS